MKRGKVRKAAICVSVLLTATALLVLQLCGGGRVTASDSDQGVSEGVVSSGVIAQRDPVELIEQRDDHTRVWEIAKEIETRHPDGSTTVDTAKSYIHEKGSGLCYRDASGNFVPSVAEWRQVPDGFVIDRCGYWLSIGKTVGSGLRYVVDGHELLLRASYLMVSDGVNEAHVAVLNPNATGFIVTGSPSVIRFPAAFGPGYHLEYVAEKGGFHQNLIIAQRPVLPAGFDPARTGVHLYTEMNLDEYLAASGLKVLVDGEEINATAPDLMSPASTGGCISFHRAAGAADEGPDMVHAFSVSEVRDSSLAGAPPRQTLGEKRLLKDPSTGCAYFVESLPFSYLAEADRLYPVTWDPPVEKSGAIGSETWYSGVTYWVTGDVTVSGTLIIQRGAIVKLNPVTAIYATTGGAVRAGTEGPEHEYAVFTKAHDDDYGEPTGGPDGDYTSALYLLTGSNGSEQGSKVQYSKMRFGICPINCLQSLANPIEHNMILGENHIYYGIMVQLWANVHCKNNLIRDSNWHAIYYYQAGAANTVITNNTVHSSNVGISLNYSTCGTVTDNLLTGYKVCGISIYNSTVTTLDYNGFRRSPDYPNAVPVSGGQPGPNSKILTTNPYAGYGQFFLDQYCPLINGGSRTSGAAGLSGDTTSAGTNSSGGWTDAGTVDIGYHYPYRALMPYVQKLETYQVYENSQWVTKARATIMFHTTSGGTGYTGYVDYGTTPGYGSTKSGSYTNTLGGLYIYEISVDGLQPNALCYYRVRHVHDQDVQCSQENTFYTKMPEANELHFLVYGDNRGGDDTSFQQSHFKLLNSALANTWEGTRPRFVLHAADFVYTGATAAQWHPHFFDPAAGLLGGMPLWPSIGNHEYNGDSSAANYKKLFCLPSVPKPNPQEYWYSFDYGNCHFTVLDTRYRSGDPNPDAWFEENSQQWNWLKSDLEGSSATWKFVLLHCPPYTHSQEGAHPYTAPDVTAVRVQLAEKLFNKAQYGVDAAFCGHNHFYEHSFKFYDGSGTQGVHYIVTGGGGADGGHDPWATGWQQNTARHCADQQLNLFHYCTVDVPAGSGNPVVKKWKYRDSQPPELVETVTIGQPPPGW